MELMTEEEKGFKRTEIGLIPSEWSFEEIGPKIDLLSGNPFSSSGYSDHGIRLLRGANIKRGNTQWDDDNTKYWPENDPSLKKYKLKPDDLVIAMDGSLVGRSYAFLSEHDVPSFLLQRVARIRSEKIDTKYLKYFVGSSWFVDYCDSVKTNTAIPHISSSDIKNFKIPLPPTLEEQQAIASALSDVDELIRSLDWLIEKKEAIKKGTMQQLLTGQKRLPGFDGEWEVKKIGEIVSINTGVKNTEDKIENGKYPFFVRSSKEERINTYSFDGEAVLTAGDGVGTGKIFHYINGKFDYHQRVYKMSNFSSDVDGYYFYLYFSFHFYDRVMGMTAKSSVDSVRMDMIAEMEIDLPPIEEQKAIAQILSDMDRELQTLRQKREKYKQVKQGMMQELLTGKVRLVAE